jgi:hypothetical protein
MKKNDRWVLALTRAPLWTGQAAAQQEICAVLGQLTGTGTPSGEQLGTSVAAVGDLDGDGIEEFVAGALQAGVIRRGGTDSTNQTGRAKLLGGATAALRRVDIPLNGAITVGVGFPVDFELQGILFDTPSPLARTNAVIASIR